MITISAKTGQGKTNTLIKMALANRMIDGKPIVFLNNDTTPKAFCDRVMEIAESLEPDEEKNDILIEGIFISNGSIESMKLLNSTPALKLEQTFNLYIDVVGVELEGMEYEFLRNRANSTYRTLQLPVSSDD